MLCTNIDLLIATQLSTSQPQTADTFVADSVNVENYALL